MSAPGPTPGVVDAARRVATRRASATSLVAGAIARSEHLEPRLRCFVLRTYDAALARAGRIDFDLETGPGGDLAGVPYAIKDNIDVAGAPTTNGLAALAASRPARTAPLVERLSAAGAIGIGKLNMHEAALGATTDNPHHGRTGHPMNPDLTPGGSSGGSAAAVAAGMVSFALGTDTMGSVRLPAAYCGIVGFIPGRRRSDNRGVVPLHGGFDRVGVLARSVADAAAVARVLGMVGEAWDRSRSPRLGRLPALEAVGLEPAVRVAYVAAIARVETALGTLDTVDFPALDPSRCRRAGLLLIEHRAAATLAPLLSRSPFAASADLRRLLAHGRNAPAARLRTAAVDVSNAAHALQSATGSVDALLLPSAAHVAFRFDRGAPHNQADLTALANFAGCPAISVPCPVPSGELPVGLQIVSRPGTEAALLEIAAMVVAALR